jgi:hypothetical protein
MMKATQMIALACVVIFLNGCTSNRHDIKNPSQTQIRARHLSDEEMQIKNLQMEIWTMFCEQEILARQTRKLYAEFEGSQLYNHDSFNALIADGVARKNAVLSDQAYLDALKTFSLVVSNRSQALKAEYAPYKDESGCHLGSHPINNESKH